MDLTSACGPLRRQTSARTKTSSRLKITFVDMTYPGQRPEPPSLSPHFLLIGCFTEPAIDAEVVVVADSPITPVEQDRSVKYICRTAISEIILSFFFPVGIISSCSPCWLSIALLPFFHHRHLWQKLQSLRWI